MCRAGRPAPGRQQQHRTRGQQDRTPSAQHSDPGPLDASDGGPDGRASRNARGKRLCATGEILRIERREVGARKLHVGTLRTAAADEIAFVAVGTTGDLVPRSTSTFYGAVLGKAGSAVSVLGLFDLDENRLPLVEQ